MISIALVNPRFQENILDGGEIYAQKLAQHLSRLAKVTVLTTNAVDKDTWTNSINLNSEQKGNVSILRFSAETGYNSKKANDLIHFLHSSRSPAIKDLIVWIRQIGPYSQSFLNYLKLNTANYDLFFFMGYNNSFTYFGLPLVKQKAVLIPLVHKEPALSFKVFDRVFSSPKVILPSSQGEVKIIQERFTKIPPLFLLGINVDPTSKVATGLHARIKKPYCLYMGRISRFKGTWEMFNHFVKFKSENNSQLKLVLIGENIDLVNIPRRKDIIHFQKLSEEQKFSILAGAEFLINPSYYESFSLIIHEAWQIKKPVLVNAKCDVLRSQVVQSNGGLFYENYEEFAAMSLWLTNHKKAAQRLGKNGFYWSRKNYSGNIIKKKLSALINSLIN